MADKTEQPEPNLKLSFTALFATAVIVLAIQSLGLQWVWSHVMVTQLKLGALNFGHFFVLLATYHVIFRDVFGLFGYGRPDNSDTEKLLREIRDLQAFQIQNDTFQYQSNLKIMAELIKEREVKRTVD